MTVLVALGTWRVEATAHKVHQAAPEDATDVFAALHRNVMLIVFVLAVVAFAARVKGWDDTHGLRRSAYLVVLGLAAALVGLGGHLGGEMVFGAPPSL